ncbi:MAG: hypothetical protein ABI478_11095 [Propionivibrio sp.]
MSTTNNPNIAACSPDSPYDLLHFEDGYSTLARLAERCIADIYEDVFNTIGRLCARCLAACRT